MQSKSFFQTMKDGTEIAVTRWIPDDEEKIKGLIQLSHGMMEHSLRYDKIGSIFAENGFVFSAHDHRGHGKTAYTAEQKGTGTFGKLSDKDGFNIVTEDLKEIIGKLKEDFPNKNTILMGHSFGSFVAQNFIELYGNEISGCILCGSAGPRKAAVGFLRFVTSLAISFKGRNFRSALIRNLAFTGYNKKIPEVITGIEWLSRNPQNVDLYLKDAWCGGTATLSFYRDLTAGLSLIHKNSSMKNIPKALPIFIIAGEEDPVGGYGKNLKKLKNIYLKNGMTKIELKLYPLDRHEIFNEEDGENAVSDVIDWISANIRPVSYI